MKLLDCFKKIMILNYKNWVNIRIMTHLRIWLIYKKITESLNKRMKI